MDNLKPFKRSTTTKYFSEVCKYLYIFGLPNFWFEDLSLSKRFVVIYDRVKVWCDISVYILLISEVLAFTTQKALSTEQHLDLLLFCVSHTLVWSFRISTICYEEQIRDIMYKLTVVLKQTHNDAQSEHQMIQKSKFFSWGLNFICFISVAIYTLQGLVGVFREGRTFTTIITVYPEVYDTSLPANVARVVFFCIWWIYLSRVLAVYMLMIGITVCLSHQYMNLQAYFYSISCIFDENNKNQMAKEIEYEEAFKLGIKLHSDTLKCTNKVQSVFAYIFSGQIIFNISMLIVLMAQTVFMEHTLVNIVAVVFPASTILVSTGFFMWNCGDVTVEAAAIPTAMYFSGWHNCTGESSVRIRKLAVISMKQAQEPVILRGLGIVELSYQSYVSIVKSSYSVFSVIFS